MPRACRHGIVRKKGAVRPRWAHGSQDEQAGTARCAWWTRPHFSLPGSIQFPHKAAVQGASPCVRCNSEIFAVLFKGTDRLLRKTEADCHLLECVDCGLIQLDPLLLPMHSPGLRPARDWWEGVVVFEGPFAEWVRRVATRGRHRFITRNLQPKQLVLDITGDGGSVAEALRRAGMRVYALQPPSGFVDRQQHKSDTVPLVCFRPPEACFPRGAFSAIVALHVLEHLADPLPTLRSLRELLEEDGRLLVQVPNAGSWQALLFGGRWNGFDLPRHPISYREDDIVDLIELAGFDVVHRKHFSLSDDPTGLATTLCPWSDPMVRRLRRASETALGGAIKNALYGVLTLVALPLVLLEAAAGVGASLLIEARPARQVGDGS